MVSKVSPMKAATKIVSILLALAMLLTGMVIVFEPLLDAYFRERSVKNTASEFIQSHSDTGIATAPTEPDTPAATEPSAATVPEEPIQLQLYPELLAQMEQINRELYESKQIELTDSTSYEQSVLNLSRYGLDNEVVGVLSIPKIHIEMPLYLGATWNHMALGFAQLSQTSMPIGGENTNCVIAGHRGWAGMKYLRDVEEIQIGDSVFLQNLWQTMEYRVAEIKIVLPQDRESIIIQEGRDLLTLLTCHPYGSGGLYRYLVICERYIPEETPVMPESSGILTQIQHSIDSLASKIDNTPPEGVVTYDGSTFVSSRRDILMRDMLPLLCAATVLLMLLLLCLLSILRRRKRKAAKKAAQPDRSNAGSLRRHPARYKGKYLR